MTATSRAPRRRATTMATVPHPATADRHARRDRTRWRHLDLVLLGASRHRRPRPADGLQRHPRASTRAVRRSPSSRSRSCSSCSASVVLHRRRAGRLPQAPRLRPVHLRRHRACCSLLVVSPLGSTSKGAQAWFQLGRFQLQPSELAKLGADRRLRRARRRSSAASSTRRRFVHRCSCVARRSRWR